MSCGLVGTEGDSPLCEELGLTKDWAVASFAVGKLWRSYDRNVGAK